MESLQNKVDAMYNGDRIVIVDNVTSANDFLVMNAILAGTKLKLDDNRFLDGVSKAKENDAVLLGVPIRSVAEASLHYLEDRKYSGNDDLVKKLLQSEFNI